MLRWRKIADLCWNKEAQVLIKQEILSELIEKWPEIEKYENLTLKKALSKIHEKNKEELRALLTKMHSEMGQTIVLVTHDRDMAEGCDRILEIKDGKI